MPADRESINRRDPELLDAPLLRPRIGGGEPAVELVDVAEIADQVPEKADLALIEMREVDAGAEQAPAGEFRMLDGAATQDADFGLRVEQRQVDRGLHAVERRFVLRVQIARVAHRDDRCLAVALDPRAVQDRKSTRLNSVTQ